MGASFANVMRKPEQRPRKWDGVVIKMAIMKDN